MKKDFLSIAELTAEEIYGIFELTRDLKEKTRKRIEHHLLKGYSLAMIFAKPSARTRISFETGIFQLGGTAIYLAPGDIGIGKREAVKDIAQVISRYNDLIMARLFAHNDILELAKYSKVPVINGLTDYNHPCQAMADALTIQEKFGNLRGLNVAYIGDANNVAVSLLHICARLGANFTIANPEGYDLNPKAVELGQQIAKTSGSKITFLRDPHEAVKNAHVIYTDTWTSMGQEAEAKKRELVFPPYQVNAGLVAEADPDVIVMHCLPAHRGQEITDEVADGPHSVLFPQAHNRMHAQKAILVRLFGMD